MSRLSSSPGPPRRTSSRPSSSRAPDTPRPRDRRTLTFLLGLALFFVWSTSYFCRNHILLTSTLFCGDQRISKGEFAAQIIATGYVGYILGKLVFGVFAERFGGIASLLVTILGSFAFSLAFVGVAGVWKAVAVGEGDSSPGGGGGSPRASPPGASSEGDAAEQRTGEPAIGTAPSTSRGPPLAWFTLAFFLLRITQAAGWLGMVRIVKTAVDVEYHGRLMGFLALSFLSGDAFVRYVQGMWLSGDGNGDGLFTAKFFSGMGWQRLFVVSAFCTLICGGIGILCARIVIGRLQDDRFAEAATAAPEQHAGVSSVEMAAAGEERAPPILQSDHGLRDTTRDHDHMLHRETDDKAEPTSCSALVLPLLSSPQFLLLAAMSFQIDLIRESFLVFSVPYLESLVPTSAAGVAPKISSLLSLLGIPSVLVVGFLVDRLHTSVARRRVLCVWVLVLIAGIFLLTRQSAGGGLSGGARARHRHLFSGPRDQAEDEAEDQFVRAEHRGEEDSQALHHAALGLALVGFGLSGAYSLKVGVLSLEFKHSAAACALLDATGYAGAICGMRIFSAFGAARGRVGGGGGTPGSTTSSPDSPGTIHEFYGLFLANLVTAVALFLSGLWYSCCGSGGPGPQQEEDSRIVPEEDSRIVPEEDSGQKKIRGLFQKIRWWSGRSRIDVSEEGSRTVSERTGRRGGSYGFSVVENNHSWGHAANVVGRRIPVE